jgi:DNA end-binding protein Ku
LISELSATEFQPENYEDEYRRRLLKAIEKVAGQEIERVEVEVRPATTDPVAALEVSPGRKELANANPPKTTPESTPAKRRYARPLRASRNAGRSSSRT